MKNYIPQNFLGKFFWLGTAIHLCKGLLSCSARNLLVELEFFIMFLIFLYILIRVFKTVWLLLSFCLL